MSTLILVRHGQACAFSDDPDRLSELGWEQARILGRYWASQDTQFDTVYRGTLRRQRETYEAVAEEYLRLGLAFPEAVVAPGLNEYDAQDLIKVIAPRIAEEDAAFAPLWKAWQAESGGPEENRRFQLMFEALVSRWIGGQLNGHGLEPWEDFRHRVDGALSQIRESGGRGARLAAFTSGSPIGVAVQSCLGAPPMAALQLYWRVRNSSLTTFLFSGQRLSVDGFNELPHLANNPSEVTFR